MLPNKKYTPADFVLIARKRGLLIVAPLALGLFIALLVSSRIPNVYEAEALIQIVPQRVPNSYVESTVTIQTEDRLDALGQQVKSRTQLERMIQEFDLYPELRAVRPMQDVIETMRASISTSVVRATRIAPVDAFYLRFKYSDPVMAARVTERLGALYIDYNARERGALADGTNTFMEGQLAEAEARLNEQEAKLQAFRERHSGRLPSQLQHNMQVIQSTQLQRQALVDALARDRDRKLMLERLYNDALAEPVPVPANPIAQSPSAIATLSPRQQLEIAKSNLVALEAKLQDGHPDVRRARTQVAELERQVAALPPDMSPNATTNITQEELSRRERINAMRAEIESLDRQIKFKESEDQRLGGVIGDYQSRIEAVPGVESEFLALTRDYDTLQATFRTLLTKSESARISADLENKQIGEQFRVLDAPRVPLRPISPQRLFFTAGGLGGGLIIGLLIVVGLELRDGSFRRDIDVEQVLQLPVIAVVPKLRSLDDLRRERWRRLALSAVGLVVVVIGGYLFWTMRLWHYAA